MKKAYLFWSVSIFITIASVIYQRMTGPTYPVKGTFVAEGTQVTYTLERSHSTNEDYVIRIPVTNPEVKGSVAWRRYKSDDQLMKLPMAYKNGSLYGVIPKQPPAGKVEYQVFLNISGNEMSLNSEPVVIRFKGDVPAFILIPHIFCMFVMLLLSTRTGFEAFMPVPRLKYFTWLTIAFIIAGGLILGPITQKYAFGALWTGIPFGHDLTDNKTLIAFIAWMVALAGVYKSRKPAKWVLAAAVITFIVFLIPHSVLGSEIDHTKIPVK